MDRRAQLLALAAIVLWSFLASAAAALRGHDPLLVTGLGLAIGGALGLPRWRAWRLPLRTWLIGVAGILGYHLLYFAAFAHASAVAVNLINYLWPLLIVALAPLVLGVAPAPRQLAGAALGLGGAVTLIAHGGLGKVGGEALGYALAGAAAVAWALYSLLTKRLPAFPTSAVGGFCLISGGGALALAALRHGGLGAPLAQLASTDWMVLAACGIGPLGIAFYCWDAALKRGDPRSIGALAYLTPLLSTLWLVLAGEGRLDWSSAVALALIVGGAALGSEPAQAGTTGKPASHQRHLVRDHTGPE